jgi:DNA recombination protein RmuC
MDSNIILWTIIIVCAGAVLTFVFAKLYFGSRYVSKQLVGQLQNDYQQLRTEYAVLDSKFRDATNELKESEEEAGTLRAETGSLKQMHGEIAAEKKMVEASLFETKKELQETKNQLNQQAAELLSVGKEKQGLATELRFANEKLNTQEKGIEDIGKKFETQFKVLANEILEEKKTAFNKEQETSLKTILDPLKDNIKTFKEEFETKYKIESDDRISLREQVANMMTLNKTLSEQANNLTQALRGQVKQQGNWGEMILESILEFTGLQKNIQYFVQERSQNDDGVAIQPDVLVKYPGDRNIIIDAKVTLLHYERFTTATEHDEQGIQLNLMVRSFKNHIDGLSAKKYEEVAGSLDFVMMFVPVEAAYITAMQHDPELWQFAYKKRVLLISPTNLVAAMKLVNDMWQRDAIDQNAKAIADKAAKIYDKLALFVSEMDKVGGHLEKAVNAHAEAKKRLHTGRGNLISQAEQMKQLRIAPKNQLPAVLVESALLEDGIDIIEETDVSDTAEIN